MLGHDIAGQRGCIRGAETAEQEPESDHSACARSSQWIVVQCTRPATAACVTERGLLQPFAAKSSLKPLFIDCIERRHRVIKTFYNGRFMKAKAWFEYNRRASEVHRDTHTPSMLEANTHTHKAQRGQFS